VNAIRKSIEVRCSLEHAFATFTERVDWWWPTTHRRFPGSRVVLEGRVGGRFVEQASDGREVRLGEIVECDPPRFIRYTWYPGAESTPTEVVVSFQAEGDATRVEVIHAEGNANLGTLWPERARLFDNGWRTVLPPFKETAESEAHLARNGEKRGSNSPEE
jgi:uncharacterized protein YndB with AHSA1/START domain